MQRKKDKNNTILLKPKRLLVFINLLNFTDEFKYLIKKGIATINDK